MSGVPPPPAAPQSAGGKAAEGRSCLQLSVFCFNAFLQHFFITLSLSMKKNLDTTVLFRWDSQKENFISQLAKRRGLSTSAYLRLLLDSFVVKRGFVASSSSSSLPSFTQTEFSYGN